MKPPVDKTVCDNNEPSIQEYEDLSEILLRYKREVDLKVAAYLTSFGKKTALRDACEYALMNGGKRFRPAIVLMIARSLGKGQDASHAALAVEFAHTASLIADDLPCMDNDDMRRNKPSLHRVYGESVALLASYALVSAGYACIHKNAEVLREIPGFSAAKSYEICSIALENSTYNTGILGTVGGQFLDMYPPNQHLETLEEVVEKKTVTLFEMAFAFGWLFGGGDITLMPTVKKAAKHIGMAFQIVDDIQDAKQDRRGEREINFIIALGSGKAMVRFNAEIAALRVSLRELALDSSPLEEFISALVREAEKRS